MATGRDRPRTVRAVCALAVLCAGLAAACGPAGRPGAAAPQTFRDELTGMEFAHVRGGAYACGTDSPRSLAAERPAHAVSVADFWIARHEVTVGEFRRFTEATGYLTEVERRGGALEIDPAMQRWALRQGISWKNPGFPQSDRHPVVWVTWNDAARFAAWLASATRRPYRLPTEAEWEFAARERGGALAWSGTDREDALGAYAWYGANSGGTTRPVGTREPNSLGIHDLSGNVWEWCGDWFADYAASGELSADPSGPPAGRFKVLRGGSWRVEANVSRTTYRNGYRPDYAHASIGFRLALPAAAPPP